MSRQIEIYKAIDTVRTEPVESLVILCDKPFPEIKSLEESRKMHGLQAKALADALFKTLPGGTLSALFGEFCERYRNVFKVRQGD